MTEQAQEESYAKVPMSKTKIKNVHLAVSNHGWLSCCRVDAAMHDPLQTWLMTHTETDT